MKRYKMAALPHYFLPLQIMYKKVSEVNGQMSRKYVVNTPQIPLFLITQVLVRSLLIFFDFVFTFLVLLPAYLSNNFFLNSRDAQNS